MSAPLDSLQSSISSTGFVYVGRNPEREKIYGLLPRAKKMISWKGEVETVITVTPKTGYTARHAYVIFSVFRLYAETDLSFTDFWNTSLDDHAETLSKWAEADYQWPLSNDEIVGVMRLLLPQDAYTQLRNLTLNLHLTYSLNTKTLYDWWQYSIDAYSRLVFADTNHAFDAGEKKRREVEVKQSIELLQEIYERADEINNQIGIHANSIVKQVKQFEVHADAAAAGEADLFALVPFLEHYTSLVRNSLASMDALRIDFDFTTAKSAYDLVRQLTPPPPVEPKK